MKKNRNWIGVKLFLIATLICPLFVFAGISEGATYLESLIPDAWITQALVASGKNELSLDHLKTVSGNLVTDYAKTILAISSAGENPKTFGNIDYVQKLKTYLNNDQIGDSGLLNDDMWAILALGSCGEGSAIEVQKAKEYIIANQNIDGGWGYAKGGDSDTNDTAAGIIALREAGVSLDNAAIMKALAYLKSVQNADGGFGWSLGSNSDSGSDSWVIIALNKLDIGPATWVKDGKTPLNHLQSLQDADGGFWWVPVGSSDFNNKAMTPYAVIALSGKSFPVARFSGASDTPSGYHIRIEGGTNMICDSYAEGAKVLDVIKNAASKCGFTYNIKETSFGPYLEKINNETASGMLGWLYFVNNESPAVGMADYALKENDDILIYFGEWGISPIRITTDKTDYSSSDDVQVSVHYYSLGQWKVLTGANIKGFADEYVTDEFGNITLDLVDGYYSLWAEKEGYVRSNKISLAVGSGVAKNIGLAVEIQSAGPDVAGSSLIFTVNPSALDFGKVKAGTASKQTLTLKNEGTVDVKLSANVDGDVVFKDYLKLASSTWQTYSGELAHKNDSNLEVELSIPASYNNSGVKSGDLIIWASPK